MNRDDIRLVLVTGTREPTKEQRGELLADIVREQQLADLNGEHLVIVQGGCRGIDLMADAFTMKGPAWSVTVPANWDAHGKRGGSLRNSVIAALFEFDVVLSYPGPNSKGTHDMTKKARLVAP